MQEAVADGNVLLEEVAATRARREAAREARRVMVRRRLAICTETKAEGSTLYVV